MNEKYSIELKIENLTEEQYTGIVKQLRELAVADINIKSRIDAPVVKNSLKDILNQVSRVMNISVEEMQGKDRHQEIVRARHFYFKRCKELRAGSLAEMGKLINKDHATALYSIKKVSEVYELAKEYHQIFGGVEPKKPCVPIIYMDDLPVKEMTKATKDDKAMLIGIRPAKRPAALVKSRYEDIIPENNKIYRIQN